MTKRLFFIALVCALLTGIAVSYAQEPEDGKVILTFVYDNFDLYWVDANACLNAPDTCTAHAVTVPDKDALAGVLADGLSQDGSLLYLHTITSDYSQIPIYTVDLQSGDISDVDQQDVPQDVFNGSVYAPVGDQKYWIEYVWNDQKSSLDTFLKIGDDITLSQSETIEDYRDLKWSPDATQLGATLVHPDMVVDGSSITLKAGAPVECISNFMAPKCKDYVITGSTTPVCHSIGLIDTTTGEINEISSGEENVCLRFLGWLGSDQLLLGQTDIDWSLNDIYVADRQGNVLEDAQPDYLNADSYLNLDYGIALVHTEDKTVLYRLSDGTSAIIDSLPTTLINYMKWFIVQ